MRIQEMPPELFRQIAQAWMRNAANMPDMNRNLDIMDWALSPNNAAWYQGPGNSWIFLTQIEPSHMATMHALNLDGKKVLEDMKQVHALFREAMDEFSLRRLNVVLPSPAVKVAGAAQRVGFRHEGTMREATIFDGKFADLLIFGLLRSEVPDEEKEEESDSGSPPPAPKKRRRRRRRKAKKTPRSKGKSR